MKHSVGPLYNNYRIGKYCQYYCQYTADTDIVNPCDGIITYSTKIAVNKVDDAQQWARKISHKLLH